MSHRDFTDRSGPAVGLVANTVDRAVGYEMHDAIGITQNRHSESDAFDLATHSPNAHKVIQHVLVLKQHDETVEIVLDQVLSAKRDRQPDHRHPAHQNSDVGSNLFQNHQGSGNEDSDRRRILKNSYQRLGSILFFHFRAPARSRRHQSNGSRCKEGGKPIYKEHAHDDGKNAWSVFDQPLQNISQREWVANRRDSVFGLVRLLSLFLGFMQGNDVLRLQTALFSPVVVETLADFGNLGTSQDESIARAGDRRSQFGQLGCIRLFRTPSSQFLRKRQLGCTR